MHMNKRLGYLGAALIAISLNGTAVTASFAQTAPTVPLSMRQLFGGPVLATYEMPMVKQPDGRYISQNPVQYFGNTTTATAQPTADGTFEGTVTVNGTDHPAQVQIGGEISPGVAMVRLILPGAPPINPPTPPTLPQGTNRLSPLGVSPLGVSPEVAGVQVLGVQVAPTGEVVLTSETPVSSLASAALDGSVEATRPVSLNKTSDNTFEGTFIWQSSYHVKAVRNPGQNTFQVTFSEGNLSQPVDITMNQSVAPDATSLTLAVPTYWLQAWNAGKK